MSQTGIVYSDRCLEHDTGPHHPERGERLRAIHARLRDAGLLARAPLLTPIPADHTQIQAVHSPAYYQRFQNTCATHPAQLDTPDCPLGRATFEIAHIAAGVALTAVDAVMNGAFSNAFAACRPPGHHAERDSAMGFCFFNNIAIAAEHLRSHYRLERVAILDWDVHHGNGTQHHFESDPSVFFCSIHQHPQTLYPGTGYAWEKGQGAGLGTTLNVPMLPGSRDADYKRAFEEIILPALGDFEPEFLLVSAGFDAHAADPLAQIELATPSFAWMTARVMELAARHCDGRLVTVLEGGYDLTALADCVQVHVETLLGQAPTC